MTIQSINAYTPSRPSDPSLDRVWATRKQVDDLQRQLDELRKAVEDNVKVRNKLTEKLEKMQEYQQSRLFD